MSWETLAAAQQIGSTLGKAVEAAVIGKDIRALAEPVAGKNLAAVHLLEHGVLEPYTPDGYCAARAQLIAATTPYLVLLPHTYQVRDFAPKLAASLGRSLVSDTIAFRVAGDKLIFTRQLFQGKMSADISFA